MTEGRSGWLPATRVGNPAGTLVLGLAVLLLGSGCATDRAVLKNVDGNAILSTDADVGDPRSDSPIRGDRTRFIEQFALGQEGRDFGIAYVYDVGSPNLARVRREWPNTLLYADDFPELDEQTFKGVPAFAYRCEAFAGPDDEVGIASQAVVVGTEAGVALLTYTLHPTTVGDFEGWEAFLATIEPEAGPPGTDPWLRIDGSDTQDRAPIETCRNMDIPVFLE